MKCEYCGCKDEENIVATPGGAKLCLCDFCSIYLTADELQRLAYDEELHKNR